jgi:prepilin signal peptidase PulO-like enzyme (type II secretory pathway)
MLIVIYLFILGACLGSFVNALVWRTRQRQTKKSGPSILNGRSMCPNCKHQLAARDLVPVLSWLWLRGKCRYCRRPIEDKPWVELAAAAIFSLSYIYWPQPLHGGQIVLFVTWLAASVGLLALFVYDLKWMLLPSTILYPTFFIAAAGQLVYLIGYQPDKPRAAVQWVLSVAVAGGIFGLLFYGSKGRWIGFGDVRLGLITGTLLWSPSKSFLMIFIASLLGLAAIIPLIALGKRQLSAKIPYGPFLISAASICLLFGTSLIDWYKNLFGL